MYKVEQFFFTGWNCLENGEFEDLEEAIKFAKGRNSTNVRIIKVVAKPEINIKINN